MRAHDADRRIRGELAELGIVVSVTKIRTVLRSNGLGRNPDSSWVTQQARNLATGEQLHGIRFVIRDRDAGFSRSFDEAFRTEGVRIVRTPIRAPRANAFAERWVRQSGTECLDWMLVLGRRHLEPA